MYLQTYSPKWYTQKLRPLWNLSHRLVFPNKQKNSVQVQLSCPWRILQQNWCNSEDRPKMAFASLPFGKFNTCCRFITQPPLLRNKNVKIATGHQFVDDDWWFHLVLTLINFGSFLFVTLPFGLMKVSFMYLLEWFRF